MKLKDHYRNVKNKKAIGLMKDELGRKDKAKFVGLRLKACFYIIDDGNGDRKAKGTKKCIIKQRLRFEDYKYAYKITK